MLNDTLNDTNFHTRIIDLAAAKFTLHNGFKSWYHCQYPRSNLIRHKSLNKQPPKWLTAQLKTQDKSTGVCYKHQCQIEFLTCFCENLIFTPTSVYSLSFYKESMGVLGRGYLHSFKNQTRFRLSAEKILAQNISENTLHTCHVCFYKKPI